MVIPIIVLSVEEGLVWIPVLSESSSEAVAKVAGVHTHPRRTKLNETFISNTAKIQILHWRPLFLE